MSDDVVRVEAGLEAYGDEGEVECPSCGAMESIQDVTTDGCLKPGFIDRCRACGAEFEIAEVEYTANVTVRTTGRVLDEWHEPVKVAALAAARGQGKDTP